jgi:DNA-binding Xre family transcriptional regulator
MKYERPNIGLVIEQKINELGITKSELARRINIPNQNINRLLEKSSIDTDKLILICEALDYDFFSCFKSGNENYNRAIANGNSSVAAVNSQVSLESETILKERVKNLEQIIAEKERLINVLMNNK